MIFLQRWLQLAFAIVLVPFAGAFAPYQSTPGVAAQIQPSLRAMHQAAPNAPSNLSSNQGRAASFAPTTTITGTADAKALTSIVPFELNTNHANHSATRLDDGSVLVVGGAVKTATPIERYDPVTMNFRRTSGYNPAGPATAKLQDGDVLISGGYSYYSDTLQPYYYSFPHTYRYDPDTDILHPAAIMSIGRTGHTATTLQDGKVLIAGGTFRSDDGDISLSSAELYNPATNTFTITGSMDGPRSGHTATLLPNGKVLIIGGASSDYAELYDPANGRFSAAGAMLQSHQGQTATLLADGDVLIVGDDSNASSIGAERYNPATNTFTATGSMVEKRRNHSATLLQDGTVLLVGGTGRASIERYDPVTNTFEAAGTLPPDMTAHRATLLTDGSVLLTGDNALVLSYDPATEQLYKKGNLRQRRVGHTSTRLSDGTVLLAGGGSGAMLGTAERFDPVTDTFTFTGSLIQARSGHTATRLIDGKVLIAGGWNTSALTSAELYDPATGTFTTTGAMHFTHFPGMAVRLLDGRVLVTGGGSKSELYDPATGTFTTTSTTLAGGSDSTVTLLSNGNVLFAGGYTPDDRTYVTLYNPATDTVTTTSSSPGRRSHTATVLQDRTVLIAGGGDDDFTIGDAQVYDPKTGAFSSVGDLSQRRSGHTANLLPDGNVLFLGGTYHYSGWIDRRFTDVTTVAELYDVDEQRFITLGNTNKAWTGHKTTLLEDGRLLVTGNGTGAEIVSYSVVNTLTGTLTLPDGWINATSILSFTGSTSDSPLAFASLNGGRRVVAQAGTVITTTLPNPQQGTDRPLELSLTDAKSRSVTVISTQVDVDTVAATSKITALPAISAPTFTVRWSGSDATSGIAGYNVEVRDNGGAWTPILTDTTALTTTFSGVRMHTYDFRVRARDVAGNIEAWPTAPDASTQVDPNKPTSKVSALPAFSLPTFTLRWSGSDATSGVAGYDVEVRDNGGAWTGLLSNTTDVTTTFTGGQDHTYRFRVRAIDGAGNVEDWSVADETQTTVDDLAPTGTFQINRGALATTGYNVTLNLDADDTQSGVTDMRASTGEGFSAWQAYTQSLPLTLPQGDGDKVVRVQFRDRVGNVSDTIMQTIRLDTSVDRSATLEIDQRAVFTNVPTVTLRIGAPPRTAAMQISNDGSFSGPWLPFDTEASWTLTTYGDYVIQRTVRIRTRDIDGNIETASDDIIYDPLPPSGTITITSLSASSMKVRLSAQDQGSDQDSLRMRLSTNAQFAGASWQPYKGTATVQRNGSTVRVYAQFEDAAGNRSAVVSAAPNQEPGEHRLFLPLVRH